MPTQKPINVNKLIIEEPDTQVNEINTEIALAVTKPRAIIRSGALALAAIKPPKMNP